MKSKVYVETYGCSANKADSETMAGILSADGYSLVSRPEEADIVVVNTCGVKQRTESKILARLKRFEEQNKKVVVAGCLTKISEDKIRTVVPDFSALLSTKTVGEIADVVAKASRGERGVVRLEPTLNVTLSERLSLPQKSQSDVVRIVPISEGCLSNCTFCGTKLARGDLVSYRPEAIREQVRSAVAAGQKEIWLTSQDSSAYGRDIGTNLAEMIDSVAQVEGDFFVRVGMMNPLHFAQKTKSSGDSRISTGLLRVRRMEIGELIEGYKSPKVFKFLHLCVQSGSNKILQDMKRGHTVEDFTLIVSEFRKAFPQIQLWTDIIVGFPTETEEDFQRSLDLIREVRPDYVNVSRFGPRPGTTAARLKPLAGEVLKDRSRRMSELCREMTVERNKEWLGWYGPVLVDEYNSEKKNWIGRNFAYKPIVLRRRCRLDEVIDVVVSEADTVLVGS